MSSASTSTGRSIPRTSAPAPRAARTTTSPPRFYSGDVTAVVVDDKEAYQRLRAWGEEPGSVAVLTDIDGTLAPIVPTPDMSEVPAGIRVSLERLAGECLLVAAISGRKTQDARGLVGLEDVVYFGNHGFEIDRKS